MLVWGVLRPMQNRRRIYAKFYRKGGKFLVLKMLAFLFFVLFLPDAYIFFPHSHICYEWLYYAHLVPSTCVAIFIILFSKELRVRLCCCYNSSGNCDELDAEKEMTSENLNAHEVVLLAVPQGQNMTTHSQRP